MLTVLSWVSVLIMMMMRIVMMMIIIIACNNYDICADSYRLYMYITFKGNIVTYFALVQAVFTNFE